MQAVNQKVAGLIPSQGTRLGCGPGPQWGPRERQPHTGVSLPPTLPLCLKINELNLKKYLLEKLLNFNILDCIHVCYSSGHNDALIIIFNTDYSGVNSKLLYIQ